MKRFVSILSVALSLSAAVTARAAVDRTPSSTNPPIISWQAPAFYTPSHSGRMALTDAAPAMAYIPLVPCRQFDSRATTKLADNTPRTITLSGAPCGIPASASAVAINLTVFNILGAAGNGVFKVDTVSPPVTAWVNYPPTETQRANAGVVSTTGAAAIIVQVNQGGGNVDFVVDVSGYYGSTPANGQNFFSLTTNSSLFTMVLSNVNAGCGGPCGLVQTVAGGTAILGVSNGAGVVDGIIGNIGGTATAGSSGVHGAGNPAATTFGVFGQQGATIPINFGLGPIGGFFTSTTGPGVLGQSNSRGIQGATVNTTTGVFANSGVLGFVGTSGVHSFQDITAGGVKSFVEPHPTDPAKQIVYIAMEGPEAGTYFRGRGRFDGRSAVIVVPESFRMVTEEEGLTVQITPIGQPTAVGVISMNLNQIVVQAARDVDFSYLVQGVRHHRAAFEPIQPNSYFVPLSADARMDPWPAQIQKQLVDLGIYDADGRVNMNTAERLGWAQKWRDEEAKAKAMAAQEAASARTK